MQISLLLLTFAISISSAVAATRAKCIANSNAAALAIDAINTNSESSKLKIISNELLGSIMIADGYLDKFEVVVGHANKNHKHYYQLYINQETCVVTEMKKVIPFDYN